MSGCVWTDSDSDSSDEGWVPGVVKKKVVNRRVITDDTDDSDREIVGCTSEEEEQEQGEETETEVVGDSFEEDANNEPGSGQEGSITTNNNNSKGGSRSVDRKASSADVKSGGADRKSGGADRKSGGADRKSGGTDRKSEGADRKSGKADANSGGADAKSGGDDADLIDEAIHLNGDKSGDTTAEISPDDIEESSPPSSGEKDGPSNKMPYPKNVNKAQVTSTPVVSGFKQPRCLDITAIPGNFPRFNATLMGFDESPEESPQKPTSSKAVRDKDCAARPDSKPVKKNSPHAADEDVENMLVAGLNDITLKGQQQFSFKKKPTGGVMHPSKTVGAACLDYYSEEEEVDSLSANFSFDDDGLKDSGHGDSDIQVLHSGPKPASRPAELVTLGDSDDDVSQLTDKMKKLPLGSKAPKQDAPKKTIFLNEPPPIEKKTYSYNPMDVKQEEFYGDVQRTVSKMAKTIEEMPMPDDEDTELSLPKGLVDLFDHQRYGLRWLSWREREFPGGGILADEMGLGKTIMVIALIMKSKADSSQGGDSENWINTEEVGSCIPSKTTLVVCPVGCILQWEEEIKSKGRGLRVNLYHGPHRTTSAAQLAQYDIVLTTYHTVIAEVPKDGSDSRNTRSPLKRLYWRRIVLDEAHNIRNPKTASALSICQLKARHRWAVTGTPVHNRPEDFYSVVKFLRLTPFDDPKVWDFWIGMKQVKKATDAQQRLHTLGKALILRRTKNEVEALGGNVQRIPPKKVEVVEIELNESERRVYDYLMQFCKNMFKQFMEDKEQRDRELQGAAMTYTAERRKKKPSGSGADGVPEDIRFSHLFALLIRLRQCAVLPHLIHTMLEDEEVDEDVSFDELNDEHVVSKLNPVFDRLYESSKISQILADLEALRAQAKAEDRPMDKVVIVSSWTYTLEIIHDHLRRRRISSVYITGKEKPQDRSDNMKKFNTYPERYHVCLLSLMAGGVGLNLTGGNHVYFVEPHWNPQMELQAQDRVHRFGQKKDVSVKRYITKETVESRIMDIQEQKISLADGLLNSAKRTRGGGLSIDQLRRLFE